MLGAQSYLPMTSGLDRLIFKVRHSLRPWNSERPSRFIWYAKSGSVRALVRLRRGATPVGAKHRVSAPLFGGERPALPSNGVHDSMGLRAETPHRWELRINAEQSVSMYS